MADGPTLVTVALGALALGGACVKLAQAALKKRNGTSTPDIRLQVRDAMRIEIDKDKLATVYLLTEKHTLQITALEKDVDELKKH